MSHSGTNTSQPENILLQPFSLLHDLFVAIVAFVCLFVAIVSFVCLFVATDPAVVFYFFYMCFRIRLSSPIHLATQRIPILNPPLHFKDKFFAKKSYRFTSPLPLLQKGQEIVFFLLNKHQKIGYGYGGTPPLHKQNFWQKSGNGFGGYPPTPLRTKSAK